MRRGDDTAAFTQVMTGLVDLWFDMLFPKRLSPLGQIDVFFAASFSFQINANR